jgi:hypothetical protein
MATKEKEKKKTNIHIYLVVFTHVFTYTYLFVQSYDRGNNSKQLHLGLREYLMPPLPRSAIFYKTEEQSTRHHYYSASFGGCGPIMRR